MNMSGSSLPILTKCIQNIFSSALNWSNQKAFRIYLFLYWATGIYIIFTQQGSSLTSSSRAQHCSWHVNTALINFSHNNDCLCGMCGWTTTSSALHKHSVIHSNISTPLISDISFTSRVLFASNGIVLWTYITLGMTITFLALKIQEKYYQQIA